MGEADDLMGLLNAQYIERREARYIEAGRYMHRHSLAPALCCTLVWGKCTPLPVTP